MAFLNKSVESFNIRACCVCLDANCSNYITLDNIWSNMYEFCIDLPVCTVNVPKLLCTACGDKLRKFFEFKHQCHRSYALWKSILSSDVKCYAENIQDTDKTEIGKKAENYTEDQILFINNSVETLLSPNATYKTERINVNCETDFDNISQEEDFQEEKKSENNVKTTVEFNFSENNAADVKADKHNEEKTYQCKRCKKVYKYRKCLIEHNMKICKTKKNRLPKSNIYYCGLCDLSTSDFEAVRNHLDKHFLNVDLNCQICDYNGRDFADMVTHRYSHHPKEYSWDLICHMCNKKCSNDLSLQYHFRTVHLNKLGGFCTVCNKTFRALKPWRNHERLHKVNKYVCDICGLKFLFKTSIKAHMIDHSNIRNFICEQCGKGYKRNTALQGHIKQVHVKNPVKCTHCDKLFKNEYTLNYHMRNVTREKPFQCEVCSKYFATEKILKSHMFWHTDVRPYNCGICGAKYKAKGQLKIHMMNHIGFKPHKCELCEKSFSTRRQLKCHNSVHTGERLYKCESCNRSFHEKKKLLLHFKSSHDVTQPSID